MKRYQKKKDTNIKYLIDLFIKAVKKNYIPYVLMVPSILTIVSIQIYPIAYGIWMSFFKHYLARKPGSPIPFVGLHNYGFLFSDPVFWKALRNTVVWTGGVVGATMSLALITALFLSIEIKGKHLARTLVLLPWITPGVTAAVIWGVIYEGRWGILNYALGRLGIDMGNYQWLGDLKTSLSSVMVVYIWRSFPFFSMALLAALQAIPQMLYDAASIDGASSWQKFKHITMPGIKSVFSIILLLNLIWSFQSFTYIWIMTGGGPVDSSQVLGTMAWKVAFLATRLGRASAIGVVILLMLLGIGTVYMILFLRKEEEV